MLPDGDSLWPPIDYKKAYEQFQVLDAWYTGDEEALEWLYAVNRLQTKTSIWGQVKRRFWGTPTPMTVTQRPNKMHVPVAAEIARMSSQVLFGEMPAVGFGDMDNDADDKGLTAASAEKAEHRLREILDDSAHATLLEAGELAAAHGGVFVKATWDTTVVPDKPFIDAVASDSAVPQFRWGRLVSVVFWRELRNLNGQNASYKLLESHDPGRVTWGLYMGSSSNALGVVVPLTDHPDTAWLADVVDADGGIDTGSDLLTAVYVPNVGPNGAWRKFPAISELGRSDYAGCEDLFDELDETYTSLQRDFRLGKARAAVPKEFLNVGQPGSGSIFNADQEFFITPASQMPGSVPQASAQSMDQQIKFMQPLIRTQEHLDAIVHITSRIYQAAGYSPQTFGDISQGGSGGVTATEITSREKLTLLTRGSKILYWRPQLSRLFAVLMDIDAAQFGGPGRGEAFPRVEFSDAAALDPKVLADTLASLNTSESSSVETRVRMLHPDWTDDQVTDEVEQIKSDLAMTPDPSMKNLWAAVADNGSSTGDSTPNLNDPKAAPGAQQQAGVSQATPEQVSSGAARA